MKTIATEFLETAIKRFQDSRGLAEKTFTQLADDDFYIQPNAASNSIAVIIQHMSGNMLSRWTNFLSEDGEKEWRNRDKEFETHVLGREQLMYIWNKGWDCLISALKELKEEDLLKSILIRDEKHSVIDAVHRQLSHYPYHVGQIVYIGRLIRNQQWKSLSIPKGQSEIFNKNMKSNQ